MKVKTVKSWTTFKSQVIQKYLGLPANRRRLVWFRGQTKSSWSLAATLDRFRRHSGGDEERERFAESLLAEFREQMVGLGMAALPPQGQALELLARHHGLPSPLLDWTESPYIAAFFAFQDRVDSFDEPIAIWVLNSSRLDETNAIRLVREPEQLWYNPRAQQQRAVFMRINSIRESVEDLLGEALEKYELPAEESSAALRDLDAMNITPRILFPDLDGAAKAVVARIRNS